jgi:hypothetical protein
LMMPGGRVGRGAERGARVERGAQQPTAEPQRRACAQRAQQPLLALLVS